MYMHTSSYTHAFPYICTHTHTETHTPTFRYAKAVGKVMDAAPCPFQESRLELGLKAGSALLSLYPYPILCPQRMEGVGLQSEAGLK